MTAAAPFLLNSYEHDTQGYTEGRVHALSPVRISARIEDKRGNNCDNSDNRKSTSTSNVLSKIRAATNDQMPNKQNFGALESPSQPKKTRRKWSQEEEDALCAAVKKYKLGNWAKIKEDSTYGEILKERDNVSLKDKWRNMEVAHGKVTDQTQETASEVNSINDDTDQEVFTLNTDPLNSSILRDRRDDTKLSTERKTTTLVSSTSADVSLESSEKRHTKKWTPAEEGALRDAVKKHGMGKWADIKLDPEFAEILSKRDNIALKDKWRNLN